MRVRRGSRAVMLIAALPLAGCEDGGTADGRPGVKPAELTAEVAGPGGRQQAKVETGKGEILLMSLEGSVVPVPLNSAEGRRALGESEARIAEAVKAEAEAPVLSAQDALVADFEAQAGPALPDAPGEGEAKPNPKDFLGATVSEISLAPAQGQPARRSAASGQARLVEVRAQTRRGVDADTAFAYATCALAGWASREGVPYARHIRTLQTRGNDRQRLDAVFMISDTEPMGLRIVEATQTLGECSARGIPAS